MAEPVVVMSKIHKSFPNVKAVDGGEFSLLPGSIHSLVGENGAGKSTMMKLLYGLYQPDDGVIGVKGREVDTLSPRKAINLGIGMVHQEFMLVKELTVLENIILGFEPRRLLGIDFPTARKRVELYIDNYGMDIQLDRNVIDISVGEAQRVEIIKTLYRGADILILDEPTAVLTPQETERLFDILENLRRDNKSIVFISHKLGEVLRVSDQITVMRAGKHVATVAKGQTSIGDLARMMVGREVFLNIKREAQETGAVLLSIRDIYVTGEREQSKLRGVSLDVRQGEIVGIAGVDGNGQSELVEAVTGLRTIEKGEVLLKGKSIKNATPRRIRSLGVSHIPEDRNVRGLNRAMTVSENLVANRFQRRPYSRFFQLNLREISAHGKRLIDQFTIRPGHGEAAASELSGGNAQKTVVAREVDEHAALLIASQPTRGVDVGSTELIRKVLEDVKKTGAGVLLVSADLEEIMSLSDRIAVMFEGRITGIVSGEEATEAKVGLLMAGGS